MQSSLHDDEKDEPETLLEGKKGILEANLKKYAADGASMSANGEGSME
jgi:hypothetical protein